MNWEGNGWRAALQERFGGAGWQQLHRASRATRTNRILGRENTDGQKRVGIPLRLEVVLECCVQLWAPPLEEDIQGHECGWSSTGITILCWKNLPREAPAAPSPSVFKRYLDNSLNNTCEVLASPEVALGQDDGCRFLPTELLLVPPQWLQRGAW